MATFTAANCAEFYDHWRRLTTDAAIPTSANFLEHPPLKLMPFVTILEVYDHRLLVRFLGTGFVRVWDEDLTDKCLSAWIYTAHFRACYADMLRVSTQKGVGLQYANAIATFRKRAIPLEMVCLPLAVSSDRPPRCVCYVKLSGAVDRGDRVNMIPWTMDRTWFDLVEGLK